MIILTLTTTSVSYASSSRDSKQTYFWVLICELAVRGYLSFFVLTALEFNVEDVIEEYQETGAKIPGTILLCHFKKKVEKIASIVVSGLGILLAKRVMDSECSQQEACQHQHQHQHKAQ
eukprot:TRINITY_DN1256_c0_g1_i4.p2 TRINITY_DN1256_c0_g1~~TRINITY_DN1256_c0_g1_i4.p2  ORF type:complete len:119 (-),score=14.77 TRINITY_DN1256_c0_g1_i4:182-538(-)